MSTAGILTKPYILFFSKSKHALERRLSNFYPAQITYKGVTFPSIENAFQAAKFLHLLGPERERKDLFAAFADMKPVAAKSAGGKGAMKRHKVLLDVEGWNGASVRIMKLLVKKRMKVDDLYRKIILLARRQHVPLLHFERSCARSVWGGCFDKTKSREANNFKGQNLLGKILMGVI